MANGNDIEDKANNDVQIKHAPHGRNTSRKIPRDQLFGRSSSSPDVFIICFVGLLAGSYPSNPSYLFISHSIYYNALINTKGSKGSNGQKQHKK